MQRLMVSLKPIVTTFSTFSSVTVFWGLFSFVFQHFGPFSSMFCALGYGVKSVCCWVTLLWAFRVCILAKLEGARELLAREQQVPVCYGSIDFSRKIKSAFNEHPWCARSHAWGPQDKWGDTGRLLFVRLWVFLLILFFFWGNVDKLRMWTPVPKTWAQARVKLRQWEMGADC